MGKYNDYTNYLKGTSTYKNLNEASSYLGKLVKSISDLEKSLDGATGLTVNNMRQKIRDVGSTMSSMKGDVDNIISVLVHNASLFDTQLANMETVFKSNDILHSSYTYKSSDPRAIGNVTVRVVGKFKCVRRNESTGDIDVVYTLYKKEKGPRDAFWTEQRGSCGETVHSYKVTGAKAYYLKH